VAEWNAVSALRGATHVEPFFIYQEQKMESRRKSSCPLSRELPEGWTICDSIALGLAIPVLLFLLLVLLGWLLG
jgi:hypothetical protein